MTFSFYLLRSLSQPSVHRQDSLVGTPSPNRRRRAVSPLSPRHLTPPPPAAAPLPSPPAAAAAAGIVKRLYEAAYSVDEVDYIHRRLVKMYHRQNPWTKIWPEEETVKFIRRFRNRPHDKLSRKVRLLFADIQTRQYHSFVNRYRFRGSFQDFLEFLTSCGSRRVFRHADYVEPNP